MFRFFFTESTPKKYFCVFLVSAPEKFAKILEIFQLYAFLFNVVKNKQTD